MGPQKFDLLHLLKQHSLLHVSVRSPRSGYEMQPYILEKILQPHRLNNYFFMYVEKGTTVHRVDMKELTVQAGQLFFLLPNQIHQPPAKKEAIVWKLAFDEQVLSLLPAMYGFLLNPLHKTTIDLDAGTRQRIRIILDQLDQLVHNEEQQADATLILAYIHTFLTEVHQAYYSNSAIEWQPGGSLEKYIRFKELVEKELTSQLPLTELAKKLSLSVDSLYQIVKQYAGQSPKEYITNRLMLEAQRMLFYAPTSVKELAYELGYNDPDYFSRQYKKYTGKSISDFLQEITVVKGMSGV